MNLTSAQSASGIKTFTNGLVIPTGGTITLPAGSISQASIAGVGGAIVDLSSVQTITVQKTFTNGLMTSEVKFYPTNYTLPVDSNYLGGRATYTHSGANLVLSNSINNTTLTYAYPQGGVYMVNYSLILTCNAVATTIQQIKHGISSTTTANTNLQNSNYCYNQLPANGTTTYTGNFIISSTTSASVYVVFTTIITGGLLYLIPGSFITITRLA
jgi:hypothetical protein